MPQQRQTLIRLSATALLAAALLPATAQSSDEAKSGYTKAWVTLTAVAATDGLTLGNDVRLKSNLWRATRELKNQPFPVTDDYASVEVGAKMTEAKNSGYKFAGWYLDDGDGVFDVTKDTRIPESDLNADIFVSTTSTTTDNTVATLYFNATKLGIYATEKEATAAADAEAVQLQVFAYYSDGDFVSVPGRIWSFGTATISNQANRPGDEITLRATPASGYTFAYWRTEEYGGTNVSSQNPFTTTAKGGQTYYAVFHQTGAPTYTFPAQGGFKMMTSAKYWVADDLADFTSYQFYEADVIKSGNATILNTANADAQYKVLNSLNDFYWSFSRPNLVWGKGQVKMAYSPDYGEGRGGDDILYWASKEMSLSSTDINKVLKTTDAYIYGWNESLQAFLKIGTTTGGGKVTIPAKTAYIVLTSSAYATVDVIGATAATYANAVKYLDTHVTVSVGATGVATLVPTKTLNFASSGKFYAYTATVDDGSVKFVKVTRVPAGTGVLLRTRDGGPATEVLSTLSSAPALTSALKPQSQAATGVRFVLSRQGGKVGFYRASSSLTVPTGKAYLDVPATVTARFIGLDGTMEYDDGVTAIDAPAVVSEPQNVFSLTGQRVAQPRKGVFIVDGKKVYVK